MFTNRGMFVGLVFRSQAEHMTRWKQSQVILHHATNHNPFFWPPTITNSSDHCTRSQLLWPQSAPINHIQPHFSTVFTPGHEERGDSCRAKCISLTFCKQTDFAALYPHYAHRMHPDVSIQETLLRARNLSLGCSSLKSRLFLVVQSLTCSTLTTISSPCHRPCHNCRHSTRCGQEHRGWKDSKKDWHTAECHRPLQTGFHWSLPGERAAWNQYQPACWGCHYLKERKHE